MGPGEGGNTSECKTILLVEDEAIIAKTEEKMLTSHGFSVYSASTGEEAVELFVRHPEIELVLMDIDLGEGPDGTEIAEALLGVREVPIVFYTSHAEQEMVERAKKVTNYGYVLKNSGEFVLIESINMACQLFRAHKQRIEQERELALLYEHTPVMMVLVDESRKIVEANCCAAENTGLPHEELIGKKVGEGLCCVHHRETDQGCGFSPSCAECGLRQTVKDTFVEHRGYKKVETDLTVGTNGDRHTVTFLVSTTPINEERGPFALLSLQEITERKQMEEELRESRELLQLRLDNLLSPGYEIDEQDLAHIIDSEQLQPLMDEFYELTGIGMGLTDMKGNELVGSGWEEICTQFHWNHPETRKKCIESDTQLTKDLREGEIRDYRCKNGIRDIATPVFIGEKRVATFFCGQFFYDDEEVDTAFFEKQAEQYGFDREQYLAALEKVPRHSRERANQAVKFFTRFAAFISQLSYRNVKLAKLLYEQQEREQELSSLVKKNQQLLREINHRVKNNLANVEALARIELSSQEKSKEEVIRDIISRVQAIGLVHELLYTSEEYAGVDINRYVEKLADTILQTYTPQGKTYTLHTDIAPLYFSSKTAGTLGIIIGEMLTNTFKYAQTPATCDISLVLFKREDTVIFIYEDSGTGLRGTGTTLDSLEQGTGISLMRELAAGLDGDIILDTKETTRFTVTFPYPHET